MIARRDFFETLGAAVLASLIQVPAMSAAASPRISPELADLIKAFEQRTADLDALPDGDPQTDRAAEARMRAVDALLEHRPATVGEARAKLEALRGFIGEDEELVSLDVLIDDLRALDEGE